MIPSRYILEALSERLGKDYHFYKNSIVDPNHKYFELKYEISDCIINRDYEKGAALIAEVESLDFKETTCQQFILYAKTIIDAKGDPGYPKYLENMLAAIELTVPNFDERLLQFFVYSFDEIDILVGISLAYAASGKAPKAIGLFQRILEFLVHVQMDAKCKAYFYPVIYYNLSKYLGLDLRFDEALEICNLGIKCCVEYDKLNSFTKILYNKSYVLYELGHKEVALEILLLVYHMTDTMGATALSSYIKDRLEKVHSYVLTSTTSE